MRCCSLNCDCMEDESMFLSWSICAFISSGVKLAICSAAPGGMPMPPPMDAAIFCIDSICSGVMSDIMFCAMDIISGVIIEGSIVTDDTEPQEGDRSTLRKAVLSLCSGCLVRTAAATTGALWPPVYAARRLAGWLALRWGAYLVPFGLRSVSPPSAAARLSAASSLRRLIVLETCAVKAASSLVILRR